MGITAAVFYVRDAYDTSGQRLLGRHSAGEGFLKSFVQYGKDESLYCYTETQAGLKEFCDRIRPWLITPKKVRWIPQSEPHGLREAGVLYRPDPNLSEMAWVRRSTHQRAYSLCGVTHTIATKFVMSSIGSLLTAPVQPWDALICTSNAVKIAVENLLGNWGEYLADRLGGKPQTFVQLPVIPLGVDSQTFPQGAAATAARDRLRQSLGISAEDIVVLFVGRITFSAKGHPIPMYLALEQAAQITKAKIHLIQAGWIEDPREEPDIKNSAQRFSPSVNHIFVDGRIPDIRVNIWSAADIFISLSDNIQETFGLTPIEAMANGLPAVVSDWNGYKESIRHEIDGFRIPTLSPEPGTCLDLATNYLDDSLNWPTYMGHTSLITAVEVDACAHALSKLIASRELRKRMGDSGRQRVRDVYDWQVVIGQYEQLWQELSALRATASESAPVKPGRPPFPLCDDPFRTFGHYATRTLSPDKLLSISPALPAERFEELQKIWIANFGADRRIPITLQAEILTAIQQAGALRVEEIARRYAKDAKELAKLHRTLLYLVKFNILVCQ